MTSENEGAPREVGVKALGPLEVVDEAKGEVTAVVYQLGEVDRDREVVMPGAFADGTRVRLSEYGHSLILSQVRGTGEPAEPPVGKGVLVNENGRAVFRGKYFLSTTRGREAFATAKEMGPDQPWSFTFWVTESQPASEEWRAKGARRVITAIEPFEVSPVTISASRDTYTVGVKGDDGGSPADAAAEAEATAATQAAEEAARVAQEADARALVLKQSALEEFARLQRNLQRYCAG